MHKAASSTASGGAGQPQGGLFSTTLNLSNNMIGAGLLSMPYCLMETSVVTGCIIYSLVAVVAGLSFLLIAGACDMSRSYSYLEMGRQALGPQFGNVVLVFIMMYTTGVTITQLVLLGDFLVEDSGVLAKWAGDSFLFSMSPLARRGAVVGFVALVFLLPLSLLRSLSPLKFTSTISMTCITFTVFLLAYTLGVAPPEAHVDRSLMQTVDWASFDLGAFAAIPIINVAFTAHYNSPRFYKELGNDKRKMQQVVGISVVVVLIIYLAAALCGYLLFGDMTCGDVLTNFDKNYDLAIAGRLALAVLIVCTFPFACFSLRSSFIALVYRGEYDMETFPTIQYVLLSVLVVSVVTLIGCVATDVKLVLAYNGSIFGSCIVYVFPAIIYAALKLNRQIPLLAPIEDQDEDAAQRGSWGVLKKALQTERSLNVVLPFFWGVMAFVLGVIVNALKQAKVFGVQANPACA